MKTSNTIRSLLVLAAALAAPSLFGQGAITPSGAPAPMMKTLAQIEPRTPISALPFTITNSGSYYVTGHLTGVSNSHGILILANDVTLDLGGFTLVGVPGSLDGINVGNAGGLGSFNTTNLVIRHGAVRNWGNAGIQADKARVGRIEGVQVITNGSDGVSAGSDFVLRDCEASYNGGAGFTTLTSLGVTIESCVATYNTLSGFHLANALAQHCAARNNGFSGFEVYSGSLLRHSSSQANRRSGIDVGGDCLILQNRCSNNNVDNVATAAGIHVFLSGSRIEGNTIQFGNNFGILVDNGVVDTVIVKNSVRGTLANSHSVPAGNDVGPWGQAATATSPWANIRN